MNVFPAWTGTLTDAERPRYMARAKNVGDAVPIQCHTCSDGGLGPVLRTQVCSRDLCPHSVKQDIGVGSAPPRQPRGWSGLEKDRNRAKLPGPHEVTVMYHLSQLGSTPITGQLRPAEYLVKVPFTMALLFALSLNTEPVPKGLCPWAFPRVSSQPLFVLCQGQDWL